MALFIGLDLQIPVRLVAASTDGEPEPMVLEHRCFRSAREFQRYWETSLREAEPQVAVSMRSKDSLGILAWLRQRGLHPTEYETSRIKCKEMGRFTMWGLPPSYATAYALTLLASFRLNAHTALSLMQNSMSRLQEVLEEMEEELHCLTEAFSLDR